jgi:hypothetical protein
MIKIIEPVAAPPFRRECEGPALCIAREMPSLYSSPAAGPALRSSGTD